MATGYTTIRVPDAHVPAVRALLERLQHAGDDDSHGESWPQYAQMPPDAVRDLFARASQLQRRILVHLASHPERRFYFHELSKDLQLDPRVLPGSLGRLAATRKKRYETQRPYHIHISRRRYSSQIWMDSQVADVIAAEAAAAGAPLNQP